MEIEDSSSEDNSYANESSSKNSVSGRTTCHHGGPNTTKTGRKGDPRMHRAVGARLANPKISLFDALQLGGFEYDNDDDANVVDSEQITLAQRKNQLSRRIRLAQKLQGKIPCTKHGDYSAFESKSTTWPTNVSGKKRHHHLPPTDHLSGDTERSITSSNTNSITKTKNMIGCSTNSYHIRARQHPEYHPVMIGITANAFDSMKRSGDNDSVKRYNSNQESPIIISEITKYLHQTSNLPFNKKNRNVAHPPSAVAVTSLSETASSLGMTLEQLALTLRSSNNLSKLVDSGPNITQKQKQLALSLYQSEIRSTYQRAMLLAGYEPEIVQDEHSPEYAQFVIDAWQMEGERLSAFMAENLTRDKHATNTRESPDENFHSTNTRLDTHQRHDEHSHAPVQANNDSCGDNGQNHHDHGLQAHMEDTGSTGRCVPCENKGHIHHDHGHRLSHKNGTKKNGTKECKGAKGGRHIHRLEGKCGHQPVLHQPTGGRPHIDFVIGDRVECYHNVHPSQDLMWPSNYNCEDLSCDDACGDIGIAESKSNLRSHNGTSNDFITTASQVGGCDPKIYDRSEINFESDEWNFDFAASDSLLGLFKLGDVQQQQHNHDIHQQAPNE
jgi:hypothetical protein